jgi:hypothetical protein
MDRSARSIEMEDETMTRSTRIRIQLTMILTLVLAALGLAAGPSEAGTRVVVKVGPRRTVVYRQQVRPLPVRPARMVARRVWRPGRWVWSAAKQCRIWAPGHYVWIR